MRLRRHVFTSGNERACVGGQTTLPNAQNLTDSNRRPLITTEGSGAPRWPWTSQKCSGHASFEGTSARARERPRVTAVYDTDNKTPRFAGVSAKPSSGLEPETPSLPSSNETGTAAKRGSGWPVPARHYPRGHRLEELVAFDSSGRQIANAAGEDRRRWPLPVLDAEAARLRRLDASVGRD
jgi:hypothetical protein